jgi:multidrug/hemolysin transport system permease protein
MSTILSLTKRNLAMFFRSKSEVFFSFLSVIIILGLYILFLSDVQVMNIEQQVGKAKGIAALVNSWVTAGLIAVSTVTLSLGALGRIVADRQSNAINDFLVAPIKRNHVFLSYIFSTLIISFIISIVLFILSEIYIISSGGHLLSFIQILQVLGIIILCVLSSSLFMLFVVSFLRKEQTLSVIATIIGTLIGFVTGAYIPVGVMPKGIQFISNIIPVSQGASLLRKILLDKPMDQVFGNSPHLTEYTKMQGIDLYIGNTELSVNFMLAFIILSIIIFGIMNVLRFRKMKNI